MLQISAGSSWKRDRARSGSFVASTGTLAGVAVAKGSPLEVSKGRDTVMLNLDEEICVEATFEMDFDDVRLYSMESRCWGWCRGDENEGERSRGRKDNHL